MIWFFERQRDRLHYEIRHQHDGPNFELVITHPDGREDVERFTDSSAVIQRSSALQDTLSAEGWQPPQARVGRRAS